MTAKLLTTMILSFGLASGVAMAQTSDGGGAGGSGSQSGGATSGSQSSPSGGQSGSGAAPSSATGTSGQSQGDGSQQGQQNRCAPAANGVKPAGC